MGEHFKKSRGLLEVEARDQKKSQHEILFAIAVIIVLVVGYVVQHFLKIW